MAVATQQDLIDRYGIEELKALADRDGDGVPDPAVVAQALADADATVELYVGTRYRLPLDPVPAQLVPIACALARRALHKDDPTEAVIAAYDAAIRSLRDIADGRAVLDVAGAQPAPAAGGPTVVSKERTFSRDTLKGY